MAHPLDPDSFGFLITDLARLVRAEFDRRIAETGIGLTAGECRTLVHLARAGEVRQTALAERMGIEAMTASGYLDRLETNGLVERRPDPSDRRAKLLVLTEAADTVLERLFDISRAVRADASRSIGAADWAQFQTLLKAARDDLASRRASPAREEDAAA